MGRLLEVEPCPVCNYHVEGGLHAGNSTRTRLFLYFRYVLAHCQTCHNLVSVLAPTPDYDLPHLLELAREDITTLQTRSAAGDPIARRLLVLHQQALEEDDSLLEGVETLTCTVCGGQDLTLFEHIGGDGGEHFDDGSAWLGCPRCEEGQLWVRTSGHWDEIDSGL